MTCTATPRFESALAELPRTDGPERAMLLAGLATELYDGTGDPRCDALYADAQAAGLGVWHAAQAVNMGRLALSCHRGAMAAAGPLIEAMQGVHPTLDHDARTLQLCAQDRVAEARALNAGLRAHPPLDWSWLSATCLRAAAVAALGRPHECRSLYTTLLPYSGRISALSAVICAGPVDWYLALLASAAGRQEAADGHLATLERLATENGMGWWSDRAATARRLPVRKHLHLATRG
jgi:hypothetical protein